MENVSSRQNIAKTFTYFQSKLELLKQIKSKREACECEKVLQELLATWVDLLQTIKNQTFRPLTNLRSVNDNLKGLLTKCQLVSNNKQAYKYQHFKLQIEMIRKYILKIEESAKQWNFIDIENKICTLTEKFQRETHQTQKGNKIPKEEEKQESQLSGGLIIDDEKLAQEIKDLQQTLIQAQEEQEQIQSTLDHLYACQIDLDISLRSLQGLKEYDTNTISSKYETQQQEMEALKLTLSHFQSELAILESKIKSQLSKEKRTEVIYDFYFLTNPEIFEKQPKKGFLCRIYDKVTSNKSIPEKITQSMKNIIDHEEKQSRFMNNYSIITIDKITPFTYKHTHINTNQFPDPASLKFQEVPHKEREQFLKEQYFNQATKYKDTQVMAVYVFFLADAYWSQRFQKFCERLKDIDKKLILVIDCEEKQSTYKVNQDQYIRMLDGFNQQWRPKNGDMSINNTTVLAFSKIDMNNLNVQRAMSSYFMQCQGINLKDNKDMQQLQEVNNDIVRLELQLAQLKYMKKENKHIITVQNGINQGGSNNQSKIQEQLTTVNSEIEEFQRKHTQAMNKGNQIQKCVKSKKAEQRQIQNAKFKKEFQDRHKAQLQNKPQKLMQEDINFEDVAIELDFNHTMGPLKTAFDSFVSDVASTIKEVEASINKIQKGSEDESTVLPNRLKILEEIEFNIENIIMKKIAQLSEDSRVIADIRI